ncbi:hypothetical protein GCM10028786_29910 [Flaviaesturariibacter terrae]
MLDINGDKVFQQADDSLGGVWTALNKKSFGIWCNTIADVLSPSMDSLGQAEEVSVFYPDDSRVLTARFSYFYCTIRISMCFIGKDTNDFKLLDNPRYEILRYGKPYPVRNFWVREFLQEVIPARIDDLRKMYHFYWGRGYTVPNWLDEEIDRRLRRNGR